MMACTGNSLSGHGHTTEVSSKNAKDANVSHHLATGPPLHCCNARCRPKEKSKSIKGSLPSPPSPCGIEWTMLSSVFPQMPAWAARRRLSQTNASSLTSRNPLHHGASRNQIERSNALTPRMEKTVDCGSRLAQSLQRVGHTFTGSPRTQRALKK